jgi:spermidine/putrescine transport system ATP-binding protein
MKHEGGNLELEELRLEKVTKKYGALAAVSDFSLVVKPSEYIFILGSNACGKSVLLRMIAGLERPTSGEIFINGVRANEIPAYKRRIPVVFQNFALFPTMTARDNIEYGLRIQGIADNERRKRSNETLELLGIQAMAEKKPAQLSAGQKQRVGLGRALAVKPDILLLDEPLGALDAKLHLQMQFELKRIQRHMNVTFLQVSHNHSDALAISDRIVVMNAGTMEQVGTPKEIFNSPKSRYAAEILENNNLLEGTVAGHDGNTTVVKTTLGDIVVSTGDNYPLTGAKVHVVVRQDLIQINQSPLANKVKAKFNGKTVKGSIVIYEFDVQGQTLKVERHLNAGLLDTSVKDEFTLSWNAENSKLIPSEP